MIIKNKISIFFCFTDDSVEIFSFILLCHKERVKKAVSLSASFQRLPEEDTCYYGIWRTV